METTKRKHALFDHPFLGGLVLLFVALFLIPGLGHIPEFIVQVIQDMFPEIPFSANLTATVKLISSALTIVFSFVTLLLFRLWFRKDGCKGCFARPGFRNKEVWLFVLGGLLLDVVVFVVKAATITGDGPRYILPSLTTVLLSFEAGIYEETTYRAMPIAIMMKNSPGRGRMWLTVLITSVVFGLIHMSNMISGAGFTASIVQTTFALSIGLLLGAIYIRTGNILLTMVYHSVHDVISMMDPMQVTGIIKQTTYSFFDLSMTAVECAVFIAAALFLLRKSKWEEIRKTWADIWAE